MDRTQLGLGCGAANEGVIVSAQLSKEVSVSTKQPFFPVIFARLRVQPGQCPWRALRIVSGANMSEVPRDTKKCPRNHGKRKHCQHGRREDACPICNGCPHGRRKGFCRDCNHYTCQVDGCVYQGHRFSSKYALKQHTLLKCPIGRRKH